MYRRIGSGRLSSGEDIVLGVVEAPDPAWLERIGPFLGHKGGDWNYHIRQALTEPLDNLESRFYVATVDEQVISQVMIVGARGCGILGHVFTAPAWRQRRAFGQLMAAQMADVRQLGFRVLTLGTGFESHPYWIYHSFGFRSVAPGSGLMRWLAVPEAEDQYLGPASAETEPLRWEHWAGLNVLALRPVEPNEPLPRMPSLGAKAQHSVEGSFVGFMRRYRSLERPQSRVLCSATGAVVGWRLLAPDPRWSGDVWLLDVGLLPEFAKQGAALFANLEWPPAPVYALTTADGERVAWLEKAGLRPQTTLPGWLRLGAERRDLQLWAR
jgi:predicted N-acetyltransferase YhbS